MKSLFMVYGCLAFVLLVHVQAQSGFISIDCGISEGSDYKDKKTTISYTSDAAYIDAGTNYNISSASIKSDTPMQLLNLRSFPQGIKNCYTVNQAQDTGNKYLIRATFKYGNYDSKNQPPEFALYLDGDQWHTIRFNASDVVRVEIIHNAPATTAYIHVCLVNTGLGTPFISALELRQLNNFIYQTNSGSLKLFNRIDVGSTTDEIVRYSDDVYDRIWFPDTLEGFTSYEWEKFSSPYNTDALSANNYKPPYPVMATAIRPVNGRNSLNFWVEVGYPRQQLYVYMHFAEIGPAPREFDIYINDASWSPGVVTNYLRPVTISSPYSMSADLRLNFSIRATARSTLPPILNAIEVYEVLELRSPTPTHQSEFEAIKNIKLAYRVERNWQGDPCVPKEYSWEDLQCRYDGNSTRIISLNLSSSSLSGNMDSSFSGLTSLESLDLSNNNLTGPVPDFLSELPSLKTLNLSRNNFTGSIPPALSKKSKIGSLTLSTEGNLHLFQAENVSKCQVDSCAKKKNFVVPAIASIASCLVIVVVILTIWWSLNIRKQRAKIVKYEMVEEKNRQYTRDEMVEDRKRQFTYSELETITENFLKPLGKGAFGSVYAGQLTDGTKVAVKILSLLSTQGSKQFQTEVQLLTKIHHRNLVSIIGYCNEGQHMALVYEYMANGTIKEHLSETKPNIMSWEKRLEIACDAAQALEYLHDGCKPSIIHRDIKTANILLTENMQAKVSDFGLSRLMPSGSWSHVSTLAVGTPGYMDPEYLEFNKLNEKSDVYSFGVVLLELITGKPAILKSPENSPLAKWIVPMVERAEIMDSRLNSDFDTKSTRKALETAMACVERNLSQRMVMRQVVANLRECLEMEKARVKARKDNEEHNSASGNTDYVTVES